MTAVNNQQVNSFLKLTQINRQNIDMSKSVDNKNILNNSVSLKSDDSKEVKYELEGDLDFKSLDIDNSKVDEKFVKKTNAEIDKIVAEYVKKADKEYEYVKNVYDEVDKKREEVDKTFERIDELLDKQKTGNLSSSEEAELGELLSVIRQTISEFSTVDNKMWSFLVSTDKDYTTSAAKINNVIPEGKIISDATFHAVEIEKQEGLNNLRPSSGVSTWGIRDQHYNQLNSDIALFKAKLSGTKYYDKYFDKKGNMI